MNFIGSKALSEALKSEEILLLDVRTSIEFVENAIENSVHIVLSDLTGSENILNEAKQIVIICKAGVRACKGFDKLSPENQIKAKVLDGGIDEWIKNNLPVKSAIPNKPKVFKN
jgi:rhodanese-related sulfurtransferase